MKANRHRLQIWLLACGVITVVVPPLSAQETDRRESSSANSTYNLKGGNGPGAGKRVVLISGDEEYRSEEALPQLARILARQHGFDCTVLFAVNPDGGYVDPTCLTNIPGLDALDQADVLVLFTRFRSLPDEAMSHFDKYLRDGRPVLGIRTATHAFQLPPESEFSHYSNGYKGPLKEWEDGFGRFVLGEKWHTHHGRHKHESTRGVIAPGAEQHPVTRGLKDADLWGPTDVYGVRLPLPGDAQPLVLGQVILRAGDYDADDVLYGMRPSDSEPAPGDKNDPLMPIVWTKSYQLPDGRSGRSLTSTIGASTDLLSDGVRKVLVNGVYFLAGMGDRIPAQGCSATLEGDYQPTQYQHHSSDFWKQRKMSVPATDMSLR